MDYLLALVYFPLRIRTMDVIHDLMCHAAIVLQNVVLRSTRRDSQFFCNRKNILQIVVGKLVHLGGVVLRDHKAMALRARTDIKESVRLIRFKELHGGNFSINDLAKNAVSIVRHLR